MSDITLNIPPWFVVLFAGYEYWPVVLGFAIAAIASSVFARGIWRLAAIVVAACLVLDLGLSVYIGTLDRQDAARSRAYDDSVNSVLTAPTSVDDVALPAGTAVTWTDPTHTHIAEAVLPQPATLLGVMATSVQRTVDDGWAVRLDGPQSVGGWMCQPDLVELRQDGRLRRCSLASARVWNGWPIPAATLVSLDLPDQAVGLVFPADDPVMAPEIGRALPPTGQMTLNSDGSLDSVYFAPEAPFIVCGQKLLNTVKWRYDASTLGQGRDRKPLAVSSASPAGDPVELTLGVCSK